MDNFKIVRHSSQLLEFTPYDRQLDLNSIEIVLRFNVGYITPNAENPSSEQTTLCNFSLDLLKKPQRLHRVLAPKLSRLGVDLSSDEYDAALEEIIQCGLGTARDLGYCCQALQLHSDIVMEPVADLEPESSMTQALEESERELEDNNYGMLPASRASVEKMVKRVIVEDGENGDCLVCLEELGVGFEASRLQCSHIFHGDCIGKWLDQSHYCPVCRFEMPTDY